MGYVGKVIVGGATHLVGSTLYGTCATGASTTAKAVSCSDFTTLISGVTIHVKFTYSNTASSPTLNVNSTGAKTILKYGTTKPGITSKDSWEAGAIVSFTYDGTNWVMNDCSAGSGGDYVSYSTAQSLTSAQKIQARSNIGAGADNGSNTITRYMHLVFDNVTDYTENPTGTPNLDSNVYFYLNPVYMDIDGTNRYYGGEGEYYMNLIIRYGNYLEDAVAVETNEFEDYRLTYINHGKLYIDDPDYDSTWMYPYIDIDGYIYRLYMTFQATAIQNGRTVIKTIDIKTYEDSTGYEISDWDDANNMTVFPYRTITYTISPSVLTNVSVPASAWALQSTPTYAAFPYRASITVPWITADMTPEVIFSPTDAISGNYAPVADTAINTVYIYAKSAGAVAITLPSVVVR